MTMESAREAQGGSRAGTPTGFRRLTPGLLRVDRTAEAFDGLPDGVRTRKCTLRTRDLNGAGPSLKLRSDHGLG